MALKKYALSDVCTIVPGFAFKSNEFGSGENIAVKIKDIEPPSVNIKNAERVCFTPQDKFRLSKGDYIMAMTGATIGKVGKLQIDAKNVYINQRVCKFNPITNVCDKEYLYYVLSAPSFRNFIYNNVDSKLAQPNIGHPTIYKYTHLFPTDIKEQKLIASVLNNIDRKIELNKQINDNLEAMAKQLYDYWFVQFDFPNEEGKPYKSSGGAMVWNEKLKREIPEGWYAENICKIANILSGGTPSKAVDEYWNNGTIPFFGPTDCNGSVFQIKTADHITQKGLEHCASSLFEEGIVIITARGSIGKLIIVGTPMAMNQSCYALQSKEGEYEYLYFLTTQLIDCLKAKGSGSVFKSIIASDIEHSTLCVATENVVSDFCKKVKPLFEKLKANTIEIAELTKQRDELLPLLMNGQATVNYHLSDD